MPSWRKQQLPACPPVSAALKPEKSGGNQTTYRRSSSSVQCRLATVMTTEIRVPVSVTEHRVRSGGPTQRGPPPSGNKLKLFGVFTRRNHSARVRGTRRANRTAACFSCLPPTRDGPASVVSGRRALVAMETLAGKGAACSFSLYFFLMKLF